MDVLKEHPELAPNVLKVLSDALKGSQLQVQDLERRLAEQIALSTSTFDLNASLAAENAQLRIAPTAFQAGESEYHRPESAENKGKLAQLESELSILQRDRDQLVISNTDLSSAKTSIEAEVAQLRLDYEHEKNNGNELRAALEERYIDLRNKETAVETQRRGFAEKLAAFARQKDEWSLTLSAHDETLKKLNAQEKTSGLETQEDAFKRLVKDNERMKAKSEEKLQQTEARRSATESARAKLSLELNVIRSEKEKQQRVRLHPCAGNQTTSSSLRIFKLFPLRLNTGRKL
ncbi:hypothetical protein B0H11DRAFT_656944 [Mycena galericulata]|nr:hypothetical protein B0H11DRAFT_656944 [Mycena galericulata]